MSGGGPHAAACGYALGDRVSALGLVSSPAPVWDRPELLFSAPAHRRPLIELARRDPGVVARRLLEDCRAELERMAVDSRNGGKGGGPEADRAVMADPEIRARFEAATRETIGRGPEGYARDLFLLYVAPWGFGPEEIRVPTHIWHGDADEAVSPRIAQFHDETIPDSRLHLIRGAGHLLLWSHAEEILTSLKPA
jgi:pimeloyl-ACP methyl ester carboxylesterase